MSEQETPLFIMYKEWTPRGSSIKHTSKLEFYDKYFKELSREIRDGRVITVTMSKKSYEAGLMDRKEDFDRTVKLYYMFGYMEVKA